ncbi:hypothetical protein NQZ68_015994 [Dissostichus eleginoides]|nr:hypothetical protein NQZ68_015994 [Dissostichus eleginoides]
MAHRVQTNNTTLRDGARPELNKLDSDTFQCPFCERTGSYPGLMAHLQSHQRSLVKYGANYVGGGPSNHNDSSSDGPDDRSSDGPDGRSSDGSDGRSSDGSDGRSSDGSDGRSSDGSDGRPVMAPTAAPVMAPTAAPVMAPTPLQ